MICIWEYTPGDSDPVHLAPSWDRLGPSWGLRGSQKPSKSMKNLEKWRSGGEVAFRSPFLSILSLKSWKIRGKIKKNTIEIYGLRHVMARQHQTWNHQYSSRKTTIFKVARLSVDMKNSLKKKENPTSNRKTVLLKLISNLSSIFNDFWPPFGS